VWPLALPHLHHSGVVHVLPKSWAQLVTCPSPFERGWTQSWSVPSYCNKTWLTPSGPPPHNSLGIVRSLSSPSRFSHPFGGGRKCSSWASTPFSSTRLAKTYLWTLGFDLRLCPLEAHDAWRHVWRTTYQFLRPWPQLLWERNVPSC
jgi:hypothetical protein